MDNITDYHIDTNLGAGSKWISLQRIYYSQNGVSKSWDMAITKDSVAALLYHRERECFLLVKQFRPPVFVRQLMEAKTEEEKTNLKAKMSFELCAGLLDKDGKSPVETMQAEILEECGYQVPLKAIEPITNYYSGAAKNNAIQHLFYVEVMEELSESTDPGLISKKVSEGGGLESEGEMIDVIELPLAKAKEFMMDEEIVRSTGILYAISWWFLEKATPEQVAKYYKK
ncbi:hypothetical protein NAEGRDRAFT_71452 [Naegleria gruberi]|uniref:Uridine diphosphate glucose pyrophosphatase NUDT14 n=1 Tax=Naegleria gruberi TaxID=5762 RepID=D2VR40_NAEGR|nr:uncharacterized protein NAEGRDRAFT_71452 [Naegleria gruberi]EFC40826.1 hypothetical protein NAEGRDRAFT_71452 [Naegleria gruberi]|eukprot:XP_002673570.1 hypothetical protein NAEGRDRAFT_71452 [Naegleria gruberi strain NEG-M]